MAYLNRYPSIGLLEKALANIGYKVEKEHLGGRPYTRFTAPNGQVWLTRDGRIGYPFISSASLQIARNKDLAYELCNLHGLSVPETLAIEDFDAHTEDIAALLAGGPVVVKPNDASLANGVTMNVSNLEDCQSAFYAATKHSDAVIVQRQVQGEEIRFAVVDGKAKAALRRETPRVVGDGTKTIQQLLDEENAVRRRLDFGHTVYPELTDDLIDLQGRKRDDVPATGEVVELSKTPMIRYGASMYNVLEDIHPDYAAVAEKAAALLGTNFVGVDILIKDGTKTISSPDDYTFLEYNTAPVLSLFYSCRDHKHYDIVSDICGLIDAMLQGPRHEK